MSQILNKLTINHFKKGWGVYWRMNAPFFVHLAFVLMVIYGVIYTQRVGWVEAWAKSFPAIASWPFLVNIGIGLVIYGALWPVVRMLKRQIAARCESDFYEAQLSLFHSIHKFNHGLVSLLILFIGFLLAQWGHFVEDFKNLWVFLFLFIVLLVGVVSLFVALYGWFAAQLNEVSSTS